MEVLETVTEMADRLSPNEQLRLVEHLAKNLQTRRFEKKKPVSLRGSWKGKFPEDMDIEKEIRKIRDEWKEEIEEFGL